MLNTLRIATRKSPLALVQAEIVTRKLQLLYPELRIELLPMSTTGDNLPQVLREEGGKGLFTKELEEALLNHRADIAVHSMKDMPAVYPEGLIVPVISERADPHDALVSKAGYALADLPQGARVATASLRRQCQLLAIRPDLIIIPMRGNVGTRLSKLNEGVCDALVMAAAGLKRLQLWDQSMQSLSSDICLPAVAQGALGIECRAEDMAVQSLIAPLNKLSVSDEVAAERAFNALLNGGCRAPIAGYAQLMGDKLRLRGLVGAPDGSKIIRGELEGPREQAVALGHRLADDLLMRGAGEIIKSL